MASARAGPAAPDRVGLLADHRSTSSPTSSCTSRASRATVSSIFSLPRSAATIYLVSNLFFITAWELFGLRAPLYYATALADPPPERGAALRRPALAHRRAPLSPASARRSGAPRPCASARSDGSRSTARCWWRRSCSWCSGGSRARRHHRRAATARTTALWYALLLAGTTCFGVGIGVALAFPLVLFLLLPAAWTRPRLRVAWLLLPAVTLALYFAFRRLYPLIGTLTLQETMQEYVALTRPRPLPPMLAHLLAFSSPARRSGSSARPRIPRRPPGWLAPPSSCGLGLIFWRAATRRRAGPRARCRARREHLRADRRGRSGAYAMFSICAAGGRARGALSLRREPAHRDPDLPDPARAREAAGAARRARAAGPRRRTRRSGVRDRPVRRHDPGIPLDAAVREATARRDRRRGARPAARQHRVPRERHAAALRSWAARSRTPCFPAAPACSSCSTARTSSTVGPSASSSATPRCWQFYARAPAHAPGAPHGEARTTSRSRPDADAVPDRPVGVAEPDRVEPGGMEDRRRRGSARRELIHDVLLAHLPKRRAHRRRRMRHGEVADLPRPRRLSLHRAGDQPRGVRYRRAPPTRACAWCAPTPAARRSRSGCADAVLSLGVVEHDEAGPQEGLRELRRILKPGGILVLAVPFNNWFRRLVVNHLRRASRARAAARGIAPRLRRVSLQRPRGAAPPRRRRVRDDRVLPQRSAPAEGHGTVGRPRQPDHQSVRGPGPEGAVRAPRLARAGSRVWRSTSRRGWCAARRRSSRAPCDRAAAAQRRPKSRR